MCYQVQWSNFVVPVSSMLRSLALKALKALNSLPMLLATSAAAGLIKKPMTIYLAQSQYSAFIRMWATLIVQVIWASIPSSIYWVLPSDDQALAMNWVTSCELNVCQIFAATCQSGGHETFLSFGHHEFLWSNEMEALVSHHPPTQCSTTCFAALSNHCMCLLARANTSSPHGKHKCWQDRSYHGCVSHAPVKCHCGQLRAGGSYQ